MPNFGMNRPTSDSGIYPVSHNSPAPVIFAIFLVIVLSGIFYFATESSNGNGLTEAEIANIDSVKAILKNAPDRSLIDFYERKIEVVTHKDEYGAVYTRGIDRNGYSGDATEPLYYYRDIKSVAYPGTEEHDSLSVELVMGN